MKTETTEGQTETLTSRKLQEWPKECSEMQHNLSESTSKVLIEVN